MNTTEATRTDQYVAAIEKLHSWGDCSKEADKGLDSVRHCHCALEVDALRNERFLTCARCDRFTVDGRKQWTLVSRRRGGRFYRPVANVPALTWSQARDLAASIETTDEVWYVPTQAVQASSALVNSGLAADEGNILQADGRRIPIRWDAEPQLTAPDWPKPTTLFVDRVIAAEQAVASLPLPADGNRELTDPEWDAITNLPTCSDCGAYPGSVEQESGRVLCLGCGRELKARPEIAEPYTARLNDDGEAEYGFAPQPARACYHPRSCATCQRTGTACSTHYVGDSGHVDCTGEPAIEWHGTAPRTFAAALPNKTRLIVTDLGGGWSWRVSRILRDAPDRSWFPRSLAWGEAVDRAAAQTAAEQAYAQIGR